MCSATSPRTFSSSRYLYCTTQPDHAGARVVQPQPQHSLGRARQLRRPAEQKQQVLPLVLVLASLLGLHEAFAFPTGGPSCSLTSTSSHGSPSSPRRFPVGRHWRIVAAGLLTFSMECLRSVWHATGSSSTFGCISLKVATPSARSLEILALSICVVRLSII